MKFEDMAFLFNSCVGNRAWIRMDFDEAALLWKRAHCWGTSPWVLEIGRHLGGSTILLAAAVGPEGRVVSIDKKAEHDEALVGRLEKLKLDGRVALVVGDSKTVEVGDWFHVIFVDGDHEYAGVKADFTRWSERLLPYGEMIFHDALNTRAGSTVRPGVNRLYKEIRAGKEFEFVASAGSLVVLRKVNRKQGG